MSDAHYPQPYAWCRVAPTFDAVATDQERLLKHDKCCYMTCRTYVRGRPFRDDAGRERTAVSRSRDDWRAHLSGLTLAREPKEAAHWLQAALAEHASVAAFAQLSLQLLALGAPPDLLVQTHEAAMEEVRHAEIAFALASAYGGSSLGPSSLMVNNVAYLSLGELALGTLLDGCIEEAVSAMALREAAAAETEAGVAALIRDIVSDEERHVALAWKIVRWALRTDPSLGTALESALSCVAIRNDLHGRVAREVAAPILGALVGTSSRDRVTFGA
jgi:hypothetical protein